MRALQTAMVQYMYRNEIVLCIHYATVDSSDTQIALARICVTVYSAFALQQYSVALTVMAQDSATRVLAVPVWPPVLEQRGTLLHNPSCCVLYYMRCVLYTAGKTTLAVAALWCLTGASDPRPATDGRAQECYATVPGSAVPSLIRCVHCSINHFYMLLKLLVSSCIRSYCCCDLCTTAHTTTGRSA
eukprot:6794-Heterococcus_DN1.PRE.2